MNDQQVQGTNRGQDALGAAPCSVAGMRKSAIREIRRICDEALEHDTIWPEFTAVIDARITFETHRLFNLQKIAESSYPAGRKEKDESKSND